MIFNKVEPKNAQGNVLSQNAQGIFQCSFNSNISESITIEPFINDEGAPQDVKLLTTIMEQNFYEFVPPSFEIDSRFNTNSPFSFTVKIKRSAPSVQIPCRIRCTLFFSVVDGAGKKKQKQRSESIFIQ
jgi:hypothetical protein